MFTGNKFKNTWTEFEGVKYQSSREAAFAQKIKLMEMAGEVVSWDRQVKLPLAVHGKLVCNYVIDFRLNLSGGRVVLVEVKGMMTPDWKIKWRLLEAMMESEEWRTAHGLPLGDSLKLALDAPPVVLRWARRQRKPRNRKPKKEA